MVSLLRLMTYEDLEQYLREKNYVVIEGRRVELKPVKINRLTPTDEELTDVSTTVWSFPKRGRWASHRSNYRGNWAPQIPRALIEMYSSPGETVLDQMVGGGTTCIEARLLGRNCIGVDIRIDSVILTLYRLKLVEDYITENIDRLEGEEKIAAENFLRSHARIYLGDARSLDEIPSGSVDLVATHPPYYNIIRYSSGERLDGDLSGMRRLEDYLDAIHDIAVETYRVLKHGRYAAFLIGDTRRHKHYVPISHYVLEKLLEPGFILKEEIIKIQHKMKTTREVWKRLGNKGFLLIYHEKLYVLRKPGEKEKTSRYKYSMLRR